MRERWVRGAVLMVALGVLLTACSDSGSEPTSATRVEVDVTTPGRDLSEVIRIGMLADLTGPAGPVATAIQAGHEAYWADVNANGGVDGMTVELDTIDTMSDVDTQIANYDILKDSVVAFGHSTGLEPTLAILDRLKADGFVAVPSSSHSMLSDPEVAGDNLLTHGVSYCVDAMNLLSYGQDLADSPDPTVGIISTDDPVGRDAAAGARIAAEELGLDIVIDVAAEAGSGRITAVEDLIAADPDLIVAATGPSDLLPFYATVVNGGVEATWLVPSSGYNSAMLDSPFGEGIARDVVVSSAVQPWGTDAPGNLEMDRMFLDTFPTAPPTDFFYSLGMVEARLLHAVLEEAVAAGDVTKEGVFAAAQRVTEVDFDGLAPTEVLADDVNDRLQRTSIMSRPDGTLRTDLGGAGASIVEPAYIADIVANWQFTAPCSTLD